MAIQAIRSRHTFALLFAKMAALTPTRSTLAWRSFSAMRNCNANTQRKIVRAIATYLRRAAKDPEGVAREQFIGGGAIGRVEEKLRAYYGLPHCLLTNNATNGWFALILALAEKLRGGEVIVSPPSWGSTLAPLKHVRCKIVYANARSNGNVDPRSVERLINPRTVAIVAVDFLGCPHDTFAIRRIATRHGLLYLSDAAASFGTHCRRRLASSLADALVISFGSQKRMSWGEGGAVLLRDESNYARIIQLALHPHRYRREYSLTHSTCEQIINLRPHPLSAVVGEVVLADFISHICAFRGATA
jgi:dTDP-4-amino-4,6-dideoxygalactose transaminase